MIIYELNFHIIYVECLKTIHFIFSNNISFMFNMYKAVINVQNNVGQFKSYKSLQRHKIIIQRELSICIHSNLDIMRLSNPGPKALYFKSCIIPALIYVWFCIDSSWESLITATIFMFLSKL